MREKVHMKQRSEYEDLKAYKDKDSGSATGTRCLVAKASALEMPGTWVRVLECQIFHLFRCVLFSSCT